MAESKVKDGNFISIQSFMVKHLRLKGNELLIYAIIYGFSQAEQQVFSGSLQYLSDWTNSTKQGVLRSLKSLTEKGFIQKNEKTLNGVKFCEYYATDLTTVLNKVEYPIKLSLIPPIKQSLPNNIGSNNKGNTTNKEKGEEVTHTLFNKLYPDYSFTKTLEAKMREWITYKVERKEDYKEQGMKSLLTQVKKNCSQYGDTAVCELIEECMANNWKGIIFDRLKDKPKATKSNELDDWYEAKLRKQFGNQPITAADDPELRKRGEHLKEQLSKG